MGLSSTLSNALAGMNASQRGIEVLSRNVANADTPGYHRQSLVIKEGFYGTSAQVRLAGIERAFDAALQKQHTAAVSAGGYHDVRAVFLDRLQMHLGKPGDAHSLDTLYAGFENALQGMTTNPHDFTTRAQVLNAAQALAGQLNKLSGAIQEMRQEAEHQIANGVAELNRDLKALADINLRILDLSQDQAAALSLMDERDRLVASISEMIDVRTTYRQDGTVALMTESGIGILDVTPSVFDFRSGGALSATRAGGSLTLVTPSGHRLDVTGNSLLQSGALAGLLELRDTTLVNAQDQLDEIAAGLALALSSVAVEGSPMSGGFALDPARLLSPGDSASLSYTAGGQTHTVRLVRTDDPANAVLSSSNGAGEIVVGFTPAGETPAEIAAAMAAALADARDAGLLPGGAGLVFSEAGGLLEAADGGGASVIALSARATVRGMQDGAPALALFVDSYGLYTGSLDGTPQKAGFAGRIRINSEIVSDNSLLVKWEGGTALGDAARPRHLIDSLKSMTFVSDKVTGLADGGVRLSGKVGDLIAQIINHQGNIVARGLSQQQSQHYMLDALHARMEAAYGVNVDEEMARLMELQNAYAASARVVSTVQQLIDALLRM